MAVKQLSDGGVDGVVVGQSATDLVGFFGATPVVKQTDSSLTALVSSLAVTTEGFTSAGADAALAAINAIMSVLDTYGLASS